MHSEAISLLQGHTSMLELFERYALKHTLPCNYVDGSALEQASRATAQTTQTAAQTTAEATQTTAEATQTQVAPQGESASAGEVNADGQSVRLGDIVELTEEAAARLGFDRGEVVAVDSRGDNTIAKLEVEYGEGDSRRVASITPEDVAAVVRGDGAAQGQEDVAAAPSTAERTEMASRIVDWLSEDNLSNAIGKTRDEIFEQFGNELMPIAYVPMQYISLVSPSLKDQRIYCGKGYFIDHALRNHGAAGTQVSVEDVDVSKYLNIQTVLDNPDSVKETTVDGKRTVVFIKKIGRYFAELVQVEEDGRIVLHKSLFNQKKEPYAKLNDIRQKETSSEGGDSSISRADESAPAISLESRDDVVNSADKVNTSSTEKQVPGEESSDASGGSALSRIPVDEATKRRQWTAVEPETAWDGLVEASGGVDGALPIVQQMIDDAVNDLEKLRKKPPTPAKPKLAGKGSPEAMLDERRRAEQANEQAMAEYQRKLAEAEAKVQAWRRIKAVYNLRKAVERERIEEERRRQNERGEAATGRTGAGHVPTAQAEAGGTEVGDAGRDSRRSGDMEQEETEITAPLSDSEKDEFGKPFVTSSDGTTTFGFVDPESGLASLPIRLSLGENHKDENGKNHGYGWLHIDAGHKAEILNAGFSSIEEFVESVARNYTDIREGAVIANNQTYLLEVSDEHNNTLFIQLSRDGRYWNVNSAGIFKKRYSRRKQEVYSRPAVGSGKSTDTTEVNSGQSKGATAPAGNSSETSAGKDTTSSADKQESSEEKRPMVDESAEKQTGGAVTFVQMRSDLRGPIAELYGKEQTGEMSWSEASLATVRLFEDYADEHELPGLYATWVRRCNDAFENGGKKEAAAYKRTNAFKEAKRKAAAMTAEQLQAHIDDIDEVISLTRERYRSQMGIELRRNILRGHEIIDTPANFTASDIVKGVARVKAERDMYADALSRRKDNHVAGGAEAVADESLTPESVDEEADIPTASLRWSNERADNGEPFLVGADGSIDLVDIEQKVFNKMGIAKAPFRLTPSMVAHVYKQHRTELKLQSLEDAVEAILDVMRNFDHVRKGEDNTYIFSVEGARSNSARRAITFVLEYDKGKWLGIKTTGYDRISSLKKLTTLWAKGEEKSSATGVAPANVTSEQPSQGNRADGIASNQSAVNSDGKDTTSSADKQEAGAESSAVGFAGWGESANEELLKLREKTLAKRGNGVTVFEEVESSDGKLKGLRIGNRTETTIYWADQLTGELGRQDLAFCRKQLVEYEKNHERNVRLSKVTSASDFWEYLKSIGEANPERGVAGYDIEGLVRQAKDALKAEAYYRDVYIPLLEILNGENKSPQASAGVAGAARIEESEEVVAARVHLQQLYDTEAEGGSATTAGEIREAERELAELTGEAVSTPSYRRAFAELGEANDAYSEIMWADEKPDAEVERLRAAVKEKMLAFARYALNVEGEDFELVANNASMRRALRGMQFEHNAGGEIAKIAEEALERIRAYLEAQRAVRIWDEANEMPMPKRKPRNFKLSEVTSSERARWSGVHHLSGAKVAVATSGGALVASRKDYEPEHADKMVDKKGAVVDDAWVVPYERIVKTREQAVAVIPFDNDVLLRAEGAAEGAKAKELESTVVALRFGEHGQATFTLSTWRAFLRSAKYIGATELELHNDGVLVARSADGVAAAAGGNYESAQWRQDMSAGDTRLHAGAERMSRADDAEVYDVAKSLVEASGVEVVEVSDDEAAAMAGAADDVRLMGSRTSRKMAEIETYYADSELDANARRVVDVFAGKADNEVVEVEREDGKRSVVMRQGDENKAGTKHSLFRHFGTRSNYITAEDIALIPEIIAKGERSVNGSKIAYDYVAEDGTRLRVTTKMHDRREEFTNFLSNRKPQESELVKDTQLSARASDAEVSDAKVANSDETGNSESPKYNRSERRELNDLIDEAVSMVSGRPVLEVREERRRREAEYRSETKELYDKILRLEFDDVTLRQIEDYVTRATPENPYGRRISHRLPQRVERTLHAHQRKDGVDSLFSRAAERAVPPSDRKSREGKRRIEEKKKEIVRAYAKACGIWYEDISDVPQIQSGDEIDSGTDAKVYDSSSPDKVIKVKRGKPFTKRFRPDIDDISLFNHVFRNMAYEIVGYGDFGEGVSTIVEQPFVVISEQPVTVEERVEYMRGLGFRPINKENTAFSNGEIVASDIQGKNIVRDIDGDIRVIDADMKLHTTDLGGRYRYPEVEEDYTEPGHTGGSALRTGEGVVYGWTTGGKVYLNRDAMNPQTPVHEYTHLWDDMVRRENPELWERGKELLRRTPLWDEVVNDPNYADIRDDEDAVASEVHSRLAGAAGARILEDMVERSRADGPMAMAESVTLVSRIKGWLADMFKALKATLDKWSGKELEELTLEEFNNMTLRDLAEGLNPRSGGKNLVAVHNISEEKLGEALDLGGFPMPSIAVTKAGVGHGGFGAISLVFDKSTINPSDRRNKVYGGDAWTPTFPAIGYKLNGSKTREIYERANRAGKLPLFKAVDFHPDNYERRVDSRNDASLVDAFRNDYGAKQLFLSEKGRAITEYEKKEVEKYSADDIRLYEKMLEAIGEERLRNDSFDSLSPELVQLMKGYGGIDLESMKPFVVKARIGNTIRRALDYYDNGNVKTETDLEATRAKIDGRVDEHEFQAWLEEMFAGVVEKKGIRNERDLFTPSGESRKWESLYDAVTLENVVKAMMRQSSKGGAGFFNRSIFGASAKEFEDIEDVRREAARRIASVPGEELQVEKERISSRLEGISLPSVSGSFSSSMDFVDNVIEAVAKSHTAKGIYGYLSKIYPDMTMGVAEEIAGIVSDIHKMSARYFEAKPHRAVGFEEVRLAVVPEGTSQEIIDKLESQGIPVRIYERGNEQQRVSIIARETSERDLRFHAAMSRGRAEFDAMRDRAVAERGIVMPGLRRESGEEYVPRVEDSGAEAPTSDEDALGKGESMMAGEGVRFRTSEEIEREYPNWLEGTTTESGKHSTQVEGTRKTYAKVGDWIESHLGKDVDILDASSGMGYGTSDLRKRGFNIEDVEPYQSEQRKSENPATYDSYSSIDKEYDYIISNAVLNVIPDNWRRDVLHNMASRLKPGGKLFINTRKAGEERSIKDKIELDSEREVLVRRNGRIASYQRFFTAAELKSWVADELGGEFAVEVANESNSGTKGLAAVVVTRAAKQEVETEAIEARFESELDLYEAGLLPSGYRFDLGYPSQYLKSAGFPTLTISMRSSLLSRKAGDKKHPFAASDLKGLVTALSKPIAIFEYSKSNMRNIIVDVKRGDKHFLVGVTLNYKAGDIEINSVSGLFPKESHEWIKWIQDGKAIRIDQKEKVQEIIDSLRTNPAESERIGLNLDETANVVKNFENPKLESEKNLSPPKEVERGAELMGSRALELGAKLGVRVHVVEDVNDIVDDDADVAADKRAAKGWYDIATGEVVVVVPNNANVADVEATVLHEVVGHKGLRELVGEERFDAFLDEVYGHADSEVRAEIHALMARNGWDVRLATEEYIASLAERGFEDMNEVERGFWQRVCDAVRRLLDAVIGGAGVPSGVNIGQNEIRYMLWRAYQQRQNRGIVGEAENVEMQERLGVGRYRDEELSGENFGDDVEAVNARFNEQLQQQIDGTLPAGHVYNIGMPGGTLLAAGFPDAVIELSSTRLAEKASKPNHTFPLEAVKGLVDSLNKPIGVFRYGNNAMNVIVGLEYGGKQFLVGVHFNSIHNGNEVLSIRGLFPKDNAEWLNWIIQGKSKWLDKEKIQALIDQQRINLADVEYLDLEALAKVVNSFENPSIKPKKNSVRYRSAREEYDDRVRSRSVRDKRTGKVMRDGEGRKMRGNFAGRLNEAFVDSMRSLRVLQEAIAHESGKPVEDFENAYMSENTMSSMNRTAEETFMRKHGKGLLKIVGRMAGNKARYRELTSYMKAKHGLERNAVMRARAIAEVEANKDMSDEAKAREIGRIKTRDYAGLTGLTNHRNVVDAEKEARRMVETYEREHNVSALWSALAGIRRDFLQRRHDNGLISAEAMNEIESMYKFYVPLKGWNDDTVEDYYEYEGLYGGGLRPALMRADGRTTEADDPIANLLADCSRNIAEANRNRMKQRLLNLAMNHPTSLLSISPSWYVKQADGTWQPSYPDIKPTVTDPAEVEAAIAEHEELQSGSGRRDLTGLVLRTQGIPAFYLESFLKALVSAELSLLISGMPRQ